MPSGIPGGSDRCLHFLVLLFFLIGVESSAQTGYMGKSHEVRFDMANALQQGFYELEYSYAITKHAAIYGSVGKVHSQKDISLSENDGIKYGAFGPRSSLTTGSVVGIGYANNSPLMDMPFPLGYIYAIGVKRGWLTVTDEYSGISEDLVFDNKFFSIEIRMTRNYNLTPSLNVGWSLRYGLMVNSFERQEFDGASSGSSSSGYNDDLPNVPLRFLPMKYPFFKNKANLYGEDFQPGETKVRGFINPKIRLSFMF